MYGDDFRFYEMFGVNNESVFVSQLFRSAMLLDRGFKCCVVHRSVASVLTVSVVSVLSVSVVSVLSVSVVSVLSVLCHPVGRAF